MKKWQQQLLNFLDTTKFNKFWIGQFGKHLKGKQQKTAADLPTKSKLIFQGIVKMKDTDSICYHFQYTLLFFLMPLVCCLSIAFQWEKHNPVKAMNSRIWLDNGQTENLNWIIVGEPEDMSQNFLDEIDTWNNGRFYYQDCQTQQIQWHKKYCFNFLWWLYYVPENVERRFENLLTLPVFCIWFLSWIHQFS